MKIETFTENETKYKKHCTLDNDASVPFKVRTLGPHSILLIAISCLLYFPGSHQWSEISSLSKIPVLGKARSHRMPNLGCRGADSRGWLMFLKKLFMRCNAWVGTFSWRSCLHRVMCKLNAKFNVDSLLYLLSHFQYNGRTIHMLTQLASTTPTD